MIHTHTHTQTKKYRFFIITTLFFFYSSLHLVLTCCPLQRLEVIRGNKVILMLKTSPKCCGHWSGHQLCLGRLLPIPMAPRTCAPCSRVPSALACPLLSRAPCSCVLAAGSPSWQLCHASLSRNSAKSLGNAGTSNLKRKRYGCVTFWHRNRFYTAKVKP